MVSIMPALLFLAIMIVPHSLLAYTTQEQAIHSAIKNKFLEYYPHMKVHSLVITPLGRTPKNFAQYQLEKVTLSAASLKRNHGTFSVLYAKANKKKKRFFKFTLDASLGVLFSSRYIKKNQTIDTYNTTYKEIKFQTFPAMPIDQSYFQDYESKRTIKEGKILTKNDLRHIVDVKRGTLLDATLYDGNVQLTFKAKSIEEGNIGDIIKVKRGLYKKMRAIITSKQSVDIIE